MKTKLLSLLVALFATTALWAYNFKFGDLYYNITSSTEPYTAEVTYKVQNSSDGYDWLTSVAIPTTVTYNGTTYSVTSIGAYAFGCCTGLTSITIPNSVTSIGAYAFDCCMGLTSITIPNSVTSIGTYAFDCCTGLTSITIPNSVMSIGNGAFYGCTGLTSVTIGNGVTSIGSSAFSGCTGLTSVTFGNSVTSIGDWAFKGCTGLTSVTIPNSVTSIEYGAFSGCTGLTSITIPNSVTSIEYGAFSGCTGLTSITIPNSVTSIGSDAFDNTAWYNNQPDGVIYINKVLYKYKGTMPQGTGIAIKEGTISISDLAFWDCIGLTSITFPNSVTSIGEYAFYECRKLYDIYSYATEPPFAYNSSFANYNVNLYVPCDNLRDYQMDAVFGSFKYIQCLRAESTDTNDDVTVTPAANEAVFVWPADGSAATYTLEISKDGIMFCVLVFNANGQLNSIAYAPARNRNEHHTAEQTTSGFRFTVTGLTTSTHYKFQMAVKDANEANLHTYTGEFATTGVAESLEQPEVDHNDAISKVFIDGQVYILRNGKTYTTTGLEVK